MDHRVLGSIPKQCNMCIGHLWLFCAALLEFFLWGFLFFLNKMLHGKKLNHVIPEI